MTLKKRFLGARVFTSLAVIGFWLAVWEIAGRLVFAKYGVDFILPTASTTIRTLVALLGTSLFWKRTAFSLLRIGAGYLLGILIAVGLALIAQYVKAAKAILSPMITVIRATPVASFIMILWVILLGKSEAVPTAVVMLMVIPIIWQNVGQGFLAYDRQLDEVLTVFGASKRKRLRLLILPALLDYLIPACVTAAGLAWKAGIAAEIIAYTKDSIGRSIYDAKGGGGEGGEMFAWTLAVILLSLLFEKSVTFLQKLYKKQKNNIYQSEEKAEERR